MTIAMNNSGLTIDRKPQYPSVSVVIPAYNEEEAVGEEVSNVLRVLQLYGVSHEVIVVDDGSHDHTAERALQCGARVLRHPENRGYGASLKTGILAARFDTIVITDADGTYPANQIPNLLTQLETADMVVGARVGANVHIPIVRRPAKRFLGWLAAHIAGQPILDLNSGMRAFRREVIKQYFPVLSNRFSFTTTSTLALLGDGYRVVYHPIDYFKRVGESKIRPRHFVDFTILVLRMAMLFQPLKVFVPLTYTCGLAGGLKAGLDIIGIFQRSPSIEVSLFFQPILSTSALLLLLGGLQMLLIGMIADGVLRRLAQQNKPLVMSRAIRSFELRDEEHVGAG